jgi:sugar (pentulose or hexulose) kinase
MNYYLGIDFGTSGARAIAIDHSCKIIFEHKILFPETVNNWCCLWRKTLFRLIESIPLTIKLNIAKIAIDGTSSTVLLCDQRGNPLAEPVFYNDDRGKIYLDKLKKIAPQNCSFINATSSLAKLFWYSQQSYFKDGKYLLHQADWLAFLLHQKIGISDYHNAIKLGYDPELMDYPNWLKNLSFYEMFPQVLRSGLIVSEVDRRVSFDYNLPENCLICAGTTDSIAAFLASGANRVGDAVTSLGSTLVLKMLSRYRIDDNHYGIYSHRLGNLWLVGGASNAGGTILKHFFNNRELIEYSTRINPNIACDLDYYPLLNKGERFPINDPELMPNVEPIPKNKAEFLYGLLTGLTKIEALGYQRLTELGATHPISIYTSGGGAKNPTWHLIRQKYFNCPVLISQQTEAAYGSALLAFGDQ